MSAFLLVFLGAGLGGSLRHALNLLVPRVTGASFPFATLFINVTGSLAMGWVVGWLALKGAASQPIRLFLTTGVIGGYTTFSTFSLEAVLLYERGQFTQLIVYLGASVVVSIGALVLGLQLARSLA